MARRVIVERAVSRAYAALGLPAAIGKILFRRLHSDLPEEYESCKLDRDGDDETCFRYKIVFALQNRWHEFYFRVNDTQTDDRLFVETISHESRPGS